jgi:transposase
LAGSGTLCLRIKPRITSRLAARIGAQSATVLVREAFVRGFANSKALGSYAGLSATPFNSGGVKREQGTGKAGNRRLSTTASDM